MSHATIEQAVEPTFAGVVEAVKANIDTLAPALVRLMANLGSQSEWSMEDNFHTTETLAALAGQITGYAAGDQSREDLVFWAKVGGYDLADLGLDDEEDREDADTLQALEEVALFERYEDDHGREDDGFRYA